jgi:hypothetical protein
MGDLLIGAALLREALWDVAGPASREATPLGVLLIIAFAGGAARRALHRSSHHVGGISHRMTVGFHHRYGYLVDPGHWRARRAQRAKAKTSS